MLPESVPHVDVVAMFEEYSSGEHDFNDQVHARLCRAWDLKMVTDDRDFGAYDLPIITNNQNLLAQ